MASGGLLSLRWNNHCSTFLHTLSSLHKKQSYEDASVACDGKMYPVHKLVLSTCSDYFEEMFEKTTGKYVIIVLKDIKSEVFEALLKYMYIGEVNVIQEKLSELINAAECLKIKGLAAPDEEPDNNYRSKSISGSTSTSKRKQDHLSSSSNDGYNPPSKIHKSQHAPSSGGGTSSARNSGYSSDSNRVSHSNNSINSRSHSSPSKYSSENRRERQDLQRSGTTGRQSNSSAQEDDDDIEEIPAGVGVKQEPQDTEDLSATDAGEVVDTAGGDDGEEQQLGIGEEGGLEEEEDSKFGILDGGDNAADPWSAALMPKQDEGSDNGGLLNKLVQGGSTGAEDNTSGGPSSSAVATADDDSSAAILSWQHLTSADNTNSRHQRTLSSTSSNNAVSANNSSALVNPHFDDHIHSFFDAAKVGLDDTMSSSLGGIVSSSSGHPLSLGLSLSDTSFKHFANSEQKRFIPMDSGSSLNMNPPRRNSSSPSYAGSGSTSLDPTNILHHTLDIGVDPLEAAASLMFRSSLSDYKCPHCSYNTLLKHNLERHLRRHTGERPFGCPYCPHRTTTKQNTLSHMTFKHSDKPLGSHLVLDFPSLG